MLVHHCALTNRMDYLALLVKRGADVNKRDCDGNTALMNLFNYSKVGE